VTASTLSAITAGLKFQSILGYPVIVFGIVTLLIAVGE
jgi:hypothetical protein